MKKILFVVLVVVLGLTVMGCPDKDDPRVVEEQYRGVFIHSNGFTLLKLTEDRMYSTVVRSFESDYERDWNNVPFEKAWTVGADLYYEYRGEGRKSGTFIDNDTYQVPGVNGKSTRTHDYD